jgi:hypothetical protein
MPGMKSGVNANDPRVAVAFKPALFTGESSAGFLVARHPGRAWNAASDRRGGVLLAAYYCTRCYCTSGATAQ